MKMMNAFVESLIQQREIEYRREIGLGKSAGGTISDEVSSSLPDCDDGYFTNIQVKVLDDNPKSMISAKLALPTTISDKVPDPSPTSVAKERTSQQNTPPPPPPPKLPSEQSYSPRIQSKRDKKGNRKGTRKSANENNVQRWGGGSDDTSPTTMPKCPKRASLSPTRCPESPSARSSLVSMATTIVSSSVGVVDSTYASDGRGPNKVSFQ